MARGHGIIVSADPRGKFLEGRISGTPKPGTIMQIKASAGMGDDGRFTYEAYAPGTDGARALKAVLLPDDLQGRLETDAYADGDRGFLYVPIEGEELNILMAVGDGTARAFGSLLTLDSGTGLAIVPVGTEAMIPFQLLETLTPTADTLVHVLVVD